MKLTLPHNWIAKILSLLLAIAIWFLIKNHLATNVEPYLNAPRARVIDGPPHQAPPESNKR
jgi:YbbR domain-containing protein